ncbi:hypothetical protein CUMW_275950, partial [Citrus unshiu]
MDAFLSRTYYFNGGYDSQEGMLKLSALMEHIELTYLRGDLKQTRYLTNLCHNKHFWMLQPLLPSVLKPRRAGTKPFGFDALSSHQLTNALLSKFQEEQLYRIDYLLGRNLIENLTVLRFCILIFELLWSQSHFVRRDGCVVWKDRPRHSAQSYTPNHSIACNGTPINLNGEDIWNKRVKVLRSICRLEPCNVILGRYEDTSGDKPTPTYFAAALYIGNARWDGVPFVIKASMGLIKHSFAVYALIDIFVVCTLPDYDRNQEHTLKKMACEFQHVPGNIYHESFGHNIDRATNELILHDVLDEAIPVRVNNKVPGLGLQLDASELNLLYKALQFMELVLFLLVFCVEILHVLVFCVDTTDLCKKFYDY